MVFSHRWSAYALTTVFVATFATFATLTTGCTSISEASSTHIVHVWIMGTGDWQDFYSKRATEFQKTHPDAHVQIDFIPWDQAHSKLVTAAFAGSGPDVTTVGGRWTAELAAMGALEPLDAYINSTYQNDFVDVAWASTQWHGHTWGIPQAFTTSGLYYRTDWLRDAGYDHPPTTWAEFRDVAKRETQRGHYGFGLVGDPTMETTMFWTPFLWQNGGELLTADLKKAAFNSPAGVEALQFYVDLYRKEHSVPEGSLSAKRNDSQTEFLNDVVGMTTTGPTLLRDITKDKPNLPYKVAPDPVGKLAANVATVDHVVMFKSAQHKQTAWEWIDFMTNAKNAHEWSKRVGFIPYRKSGLQDATLRKDPNFQVLMNEITHSRTYPTLPEWPQIDDLLAQAINAALAGKQTPKEALDDAASQVNELLAQSQ